MPPDKSTSTYLPPFSATLFTSASLVTRVKKVMFTQRRQGAKMRNVR